MRVRRAEAQDLAAIEAIQESSLAQSHWHASDYLKLLCVVAEVEGIVVGFAVVRHILPDESEVISLAVAPGFRRLGVGAALVEEACLERGRAYFLEVRESNEAARQLYEQLGFTAIGRRPDYYQNPPEAGIVMKFQS